ncbi:hydroxysteroid (20-beta) dehydrogenase 2 isoform X1 [Gasterosteus aculeatus]
MSFTDKLAVIGGFTVVFQLLRLAWRCWCGFRQFVLSELWHVDLKTYGQWAVVTGATSGIGKAYARELAQRGLDVILVSRCDDKLRMIAKEIEEQYGQKTRTIQVDFTDSQRIYPAIAKQLEGLEIGILVNNVGMTYSDHFAYFLEIPDAEQKITQIINCNMLSVPQMTRLVLPGMVERYHHKHPDVTGSYEVMRIYDEFMDICLLRGIGLIVNMSSEVGVRPQPLLSLYCATKVLSHSDITSFMCLQTRPDRLPAYSLKQLHDTCFVTFFFSEFCNVLLSVSACRVQIKGNYCSVCGPLHGVHQHDETQDSQLLREERFRFRPRGLEHRWSIQLHQRLSVPRAAEHGSYNTPAGLVSYVVIRREKATGLCSSQPRRQKRVRGKEAR